MKFQYIKTGEKYKMLNTVLLKQDGKWINIITYEKLGVLSPVYARHEDDFYNKFIKLN